MLYGFNIGAASSDHLGGTMTTDSIKYGHAVPVTEDDLADTADIHDILSGSIHDILSGRPPTPASAAAHAASEAARRARIAVLRQEHASLVASLTGPARAVAELHAVDDRGTCTGCDIDDRETERPEWPCTTIYVLREST